MKNPQPRHSSLTKATILVALLSLNSGLQAQDYDPKLARMNALFNSSEATAATSPVVEYATHRNGNIELVVANNGTFGTFGGTIEDPLSGEALRSCVYPKSSDIIYLYVAAFWIGAVVGRDTLVSTGSEDYYENQELWPEVKPLGEFRLESIDAGSPFYAATARSEHDVICEYTDTLTTAGMTGTDMIDNRPHIPLGIKVTQRSMSWSYSYADDFILFDMVIQNIGGKKLEDVYMGIWIDSDVWHTTNFDPEHYQDDIVGFYRTHPSTAGCGFLDTINIAYCGDNDGDPVDGQWNEKSPLGVVGAQVVRTPSDSLDYSFNWWVTSYGDPAYDFGPRLKPTPTDPFRSFGANLGTPFGDRNRYYILRHPEFDYDIMYTAVDHSAEGWLAPPEQAERLAEGFDVRYLFSFGPFNISPGERLPIDFTWVGGENLHQNPTDFEQYFNPYKPDPYYDRLNFNNLATNGRWASWVYDNPGVDTDNDGYAGKYHVCNYDSAYVTIDTTIGGRDTTITVLRYTLADTTYYEGDGVPDFSGASPPPPPVFWIEPSVGSFRIRINGLASETTADRFSNVVDFEGYRVYMGRDNRASSFSLLGSYDREDYNKFVYNALATPEPKWELRDLPYTREALACLYGDSCNDPYFDPLYYTRAHPYVHPSYPDSIFYFVEQDFNQSEFGVTTDIRKRYPDQPYPSTLNVLEAQPDELTEDGYFKYFEYEMTIDDLLPTVPYFVSLTAFDFGSPEAGLRSLESPILNNVQTAYPLASVEEVQENNLQVYVYPNPYRIDADYIGSGYENRDGSRAVERARLLHFANLPKVCKIYIYSLDGDLVRELDHNYPDGGPEAMHQTWDLITRNTQAVVSGLYYFVVESESGTQIGKFAILK